MSPSEKDQILKRIEEGSARLAEYAGLAPETLSKPYAPGKWTGVQVLFHLAQTDTVLLYRFFKTVAEPGSPIVPFDQDRWVAEPDAASRPVRLSVELSLGARQVLAHCLRSLSDEVLARSGRHPERGELSALGIAKIAADHTLHHLEQLEAIRAGQPWKPK
ncbi:MAG: DinB family protein [Candidatus Omnitrophica bacterium]|nr:DinB family protein [Candidatus Omnitrophota bacterium]